MEYSLLFLGIEKLKKIRYKIMNIITDWIEEVQDLYAMKRTYKVLDLLDGLDFIQQIADELELNVEIDICPIDSEEL